MDTVQVWVGGMTQEDSTLEATLSGDLVVTDLPAYISPNHLMILKLVSDSSVQAAGFSAEYTTGKAELRLLLTSLSHAIFQWKWKHASVFKLVPGNLFLTFAESILPVGETLIAPVDNPETISSPGYPNGFSSMIRQTWVIEAERIAVISLQVSSDETILIKTWFGTIFKFSWDRVKPKPKDLVMALALVVYMY